MKNNILLIAAVTIISLGVITAVIILSTHGASGSENSSDSSYNSATETATEQSAFIDESTEAPVISIPETQTETETLVPETETPVSSESASSDVVTAVTDMAQSLIGVPFADGGDSPAGFDNSGFIYYVLRQNGFLACPRGVVAQSTMGTRLEYDELKKGDLVFFYNDSKTDAGFGGIYIGGGKMIACLMPGTLVKEVDITGDYYKTNFFGGVSLS